MFVVQKGGTNMKKLLVALCALALMVLPLFAQGGAETAVDDLRSQLAIYTTVCPSPLI